MEETKRIKLIISGIIGILVIFMVIYSINIFGGKKSEENNDSGHISFEAPKLSEIKYNYNKKIDIESQKEIKSSNISLDDLDLGKDSIKEEVENINNDIKEEVRSQLPKQDNEKTIISHVPKTNTQPAKTKVSNKIKVEKEVKEKQEIETTTRRKKRVLSSADSNKTNEQKIEKTDQTIPCRVYGAQKVRDNSKLKARITQKVLIDGITINRNTIITGIVNITNNKVRIKFETIQYKGKSLPINMQAYSRDGLEGIYIEGDIQNDAKKDAYSETINYASSSTTSKIPILGSVLKSTTSGLNRETYVNIPNDYILYLKQ